MRNKHWALRLSVGFLLAGGVSLAAATPAPQAIANTVTHHYDIAAGELGAALNQLAAQSDAQILYAPALVQGKTSEGLKGSYSVGDALRRLLRGSGLHGEAVNADTWVLRDGADPQPSRSRPQSSSEKHPVTLAPTRLEGVQVTGSLIPKSEIETAAPTIQITAQEMVQRGFDTVYDALRSLPMATGAVPGSQGASTFTTGAKKLSLFGLPPGFTLIMVDGHPLPDYPLLYQGTSNFNDLSGVPFAMVDHIDIVPGNQSAVYGSSAIAGVVNIVLKKHVKGIHLKLRTGGYTQGGGNSQRFELVGGHSWLDDHLDVTYGFQYSNQKPIWAYDRDLTATTASNPTTPEPVARQTFMHAFFDATGSQVFVAPPAGACQAVGDLYSGTTYRAHGPAGAYCGTNAAGYRTMMNGERRYTGYGSGSFEINDDTELYATGTWSVARQRYAPLGGFIWLPNIDGLGMFVDANSGHLSTAWRQLAPEEQDYGQSQTRQSVHSYQAVLGLRGYFGDSDWQYDGYLDRAQQIVNNRQLHPLTREVNQFFRQQFLGPKLGEDAATGYPIFQPDWSAFYQPITPDQYRAFSADVQTRSASSIEHATFRINNTALFELPAGDASLAAQVQAGHQAWDNPTDPRVIQGDFWGLSGTTGHGDRDSSSAAVELNVPVASMLTVDGSARYDRYRFAGRTDGKATWRVGLEFRPTQTLLVRGNYGTAFRAPDMGRIFLAPTTTFFGVTDYYLCQVRQPGVPLANCNYDNVQTRGESSGNRDLDDITAKSWGVGLVWSPAPAFNLHADFLHIHMANEIEDTNIDQLMRDDAACLLGNMDAGSPTCVDAKDRVTRDSQGNITFIRSVPINIANEELETVTAGASYRLKTASAGRFTLSAEYNDVLTHKRQLFPGDPKIDLLRDPTQSTEFKTIVNGSVHWDFRNWDASLFAVRYGRTPNFRAQLAGYEAPGAGRLHPWTVTNLNLGYRFSDAIHLGLTVNNVFNKAPPRDDTYARWPYYNGQNYNIYGRAWYLQLDLAFGGDNP